ncbi:major capsid protein P2 [Algihabitans albus]|uniref:major capsid protein P2 n=1 Tax=Algihabitans albus TaxID=2164067 RepID=UPI0035D0C4AB
MRDFIATNSFNAVAPGATATLDLPTGALIYHGLQILYGTGTAGGPTQANIEAEITAVRIKLNGKVQRRFSAAELFAINAFHGVGFETGIVQVFFSEPWRRTAEGEDALAWGMLDIDTFQIEVDIAGSATSPTLEARAEVMRGNRNLGPITKWRRYTVPVSGVGTVNYTTLPKNDAYFKLHCFSGDVTAIDVRVDQLERFEATAARNVARLKQVYAKAPQSGVFHAVFDPTDRVSDALSMRRPDGMEVSEFRVDFEMGAANSFNMITETIGPRD